MLPATLALIDDDLEYTDFLSEHLRGLGVQVDVFRDSTDLLVHPEPYAYGFYVVDLMLPGVDGVNLIKVLRRRTDAGVLVVSGRNAPEVFKDIIDAGADMYLAKPVQFEQVALAIAAVQRRAGGAKAAQAAQWKLDRRASQLVAPDGSRVELSDADLSVMECFVEAQGEVVSRESLLQRLGRSTSADSGGDGLNAVIFRLRRRVERATPAVVPLQTKARVGYVFRAPLIAV